MQNNPTLDALNVLRSSSLPMLVQEEIERLIMNGELPVGSRLNESDLALRFGTSRGPVREALRALEEVGLVRTERNRGFFVREISFEEVEEIYEIREVLEELIGRRVALSMTDERRARLGALINEMESTAAQGSIEGYAALNLKFHETLLAYAGSEKLRETYSRLTKELHLFRMRALADGGGLKVSAAEHRRILDAIASGDPELAGAALRRHVVASRQRMHKAFNLPDGG